MNTIIFIIVLLVKNIDTDYSASAGEIQSSQKAPKFKVGENYHENCHGKPGNVMGFCF